MNSLQKTGTGGAVATRAPVAEPTLSLALDWRVSRFERGMDLMTALLSPAEREEAAEKALAYGPMLQPARQARIEKWFDQVVLDATVRISDGDKLVRLDLVIATSGDLPAGVWTGETRAAFARARGAESRFIPASGEIDAFLRPMAERMRRTARALAEMAKPVAPEPKAIEPTDEEKEAVSAKVREALASMGDGFRTRRTDQDAPMRRVTLTGRDLWERRNAMRAASGMPRLPMPATFDGYGETE